MASTNKSIKKKTLVPSIVIGLCVIAFFAGYFGITIKKNTALEKEARMLEKELALYKNGVKNYPSKERMMFLQTQEKELQTQLSNLYKYPVAWSKVQDAYEKKMTPLQFKEEVYQMQMRLQQKAQIENVFLCDDLGFSDWQNKLPDASKLTELFQAIDIVEELGTMLIDAKVVSLDNIMISDISNIKLRTAHTQDSYKKREIIISIKATSAQLIAFFHNIEVSEYMIYVNNFKIDYYKENRKKTRQKKETESFEKANNPSDPLLAATITVVNMYL